MNYTAQDAEDWSRFWRSEVGGTPPAIPTVERQLNITQKEQLRGWDSGRLHQRLFASRKPEGMPAETFAHHLTGAYVPEDIPVLREFGYEAKAQELEAQVREAERIIMENKIAESAQRNAENEKRLAAWQKLTPQQKLAAAGPLPPEVIARNRAQFGLTGKPSWEQ